MRDTVPGQFKGNTIIVKNNLYILYNNVVYGGNQKSKLFFFSEQIGECSRNPTSKKLPLLEKKIRRM